MEYLYLIIAGLFGGFLAGLLGVGGGVIFVFVLSFYFGSLNIEETELPKYLISNSIFATFFAGVSSSLKNRNLQTFYWKEVLYCAIPGVLSALLFSYLITEFTWYDKKKFTLFFVVLLLFFFVKIMRSRKKDDAENADKKVSFIKVGLIGALSGIVSALSGLGGGVIMIPLLNQVIGMSMKKAASVSLGVIPFFALAMSVFYGTLFTPSLDIAYSAGYLVFPAAIPLALGVIVAAPYGVKAARKLPARLIKVMFAILLAIVALKMIIGYLN